MMSFKKFGLVTAIGLLSASAFAMEAVDDDALSDTTGQDGVTLTITPPAGGISWSTVIHDSNGFTGSTGAGAIVLGDPLAAGTYTKTSINTGGAGITALIDATGAVNGTANTPSLNIAITIPTGTVIHTGDISVAVSNGLGVAVTTQSAKILQDMTLTLGATTATLSLGNENPNAAQASMIRLTTTMTGGLNIANFVLNDGGGTVTGGAFRATNIKMVDTTGTTNLAVDAKVDVGTTGLLVNLVTLGTGGMNAQITGLSFGNAAATAIGNVDVIGMQLAGTTVLVAGH